MTTTDVPTQLVAASPELLRQLGQIARQLHDTLRQLGIKPNLQQSAEGLSEARARLSYIAHKTGDAADRVLTAVESAKEEQARLIVAAKKMLDFATASGARPDAAAEAAGWMDELDAAASRIDGHLTEIMLAQDFHDLTGQVVAKVIALAMDLEDGLIRLLLQAAPGEAGVNGDTAALAGPVVAGTSRVDVVANQSEVDALLSEMGF